MGARDGQALDPKKTVSQYVREAWTTAHGLPQNTINAIAQTSDGYLWIATFGGLARFDGFEFTVLDTGQDTGLESNRLTALTTAPDGALWIGSEDGRVIALRGGAFETVARELGTVWDLEADGEALWVGTQRGLYRISNGLASRVEPKNDRARSVHSLERDARGQLWVGLSGGLARCCDGDGRLETVATLRGQVHGIQVVAHGLVVATGRGLALVREGREPEPLWEHQEPREILSGGVVSDRAGHLWFSDLEGLRRLTYDRPSTPDDTLFLADQTANPVRSLFEDREGNLWVGTNTAGLLRLGDGAFSSYTAEQGFSNAAVSAITEDDAGRLWLGTSCEGLWSYQDGVFTRLPVPGSPPLRCVRALLVDGRGRLWASGSGLARVTGEKIERLPQFAGALAMFEDRDGVIWIGRRHGLLMGVVDDRVIEEYGQDEGLRGDVVFLTEDRSGSLWAGTSEGLYRLRQGELRRYTTEDGLPHRFVRAIHQDSEGLLWLGTYGGGLSLFDGEASFATINSSHGLPENVISRILEDDAGSFWLAGNRGITRAERSQLLAVGRGEVSRLSASLYGEADGMITSETNGGSQPTGWRARDGRLWFPTIRGAVAVSPDRLRPTTPPPLVIERLEIDGNPIPVGDALSAAPGSSRLEIQYAGLQYSLPREVRYRYRLPPLEIRWREVGNRTEASFTNVHPGSYRFEVSAAAHPGAEWSQPVGLDVEFQPFVWQTPWFRWSSVLIAGLLLTTLGWAIHRLRLRAAFRRARTLEASNLALSREVERRRETEQEKQLFIDELEARNAEVERFAYTASHDLKSPLYTIQGFTGMALKELDRNNLQKARQDVERIDAASRRMDSSINDLLSLARVGRVADPSEELATGELVSEALELFSADIEARGVEVVVADELPAVVGDRARLLEVFENLISNALKSFDGAASPRLEIGWRRDRSDPRERGAEEQLSVGETDHAVATLFVKDNGCGIDPEYHEKIFGLFERLDPASEGTGVGLAIVKRVVEVHGGRVWVESKGEGRGATFCFTLART